jgi:hypothetical protein
MGQWYNKFGMYQSQRTILVTPPSMHRKDAILTFMKSEMIWSLTNLKSYKRVVILIIWKKYYIELFIKYIFVVKLVGDLNVNTIRYKFSWS